MGSATFITDLSQVTRLEGLYIKERKPPASVKGVFLGAIGIVGECVRGPVDQVVHISSEARFLEVFGGRDTGSGGTVKGKVWQSLLNKRFGDLYIVRTAAAAAVKATASFDGYLQVDANGPGVWGNDITIDIADATNGDIHAFNLHVNYLGTEVAVYEDILINGSDEDNILSVVGEDEGNYVVLSKIGSGRPANATATALTTGADGSIADSDFTATNRGLNLLKDYKGLAAVFIAERSSSTLKAALKAAAGASSDRLFICSPDSGSVSLSTAEAEAITLAGSNDRLVYAFNHPYTLDPETGTLIQTDPASWMASVISQISVNINPGDADNQKFLSGISKLTYPSISRNDYIALRDSGIAAIEYDGGYNFVSGITTDETEIVDRREQDWLELSIANALKYSVKKPNTIQQREANISLITSFLQQNKDAQFVVEDYLVDGEVLNTPASRAQNIEKILMRVRLIGHQNFILLETEIGTSVTIKQTA